MILLNKAVIRGWALLPTSCTSVWSVFIASEVAVLGKKIDMVGNDHQVAGKERGIDSSCGIGDEKVLHADFMQHAHRKRDLLHGIAFVVVETSLHGDDVLPAESADEEVAFVPLHGGHREMGDGGIGDGMPDVDGGSQFSQSGA